MEVEMHRTVLFTLFTLIGIVFSASCSPRQVSPTPEEDMPNPASVYCEQNGGDLELRQDASGGVAGICVFPDGSECDEWAYFRSECKPGDTLVTSEPTASPAPSEPAPTATAEFASDGWRVYRNVEFGYSFHYPADASIVANDDPLVGLSIIGSLSGNESWPQISISHPRDREEYRPPEGVDLVQWLTDHFLLGDERLPDVQIAGTTAIHLRHERSPQSYAHDRYYFAKSGQLFMVVIGHVADREDWELYSHFLESIQFEQ
jgi:putative hemolysin